MKKALLSTFCIIIILIFILIIMSLYSRVIRYTEVKNALNISMQQSIAQLETDNGGPTTEDEWLSTFATSVASQIHSCSNLEICIYAADFEKGLLSAEATLTYQNLIGTTSSVSTGKRIILLESYTN